MMGKSINKNMKKSFRRALIIPVIIFCIALNEFSIYGMQNYLNECELYDLHKYNKLKKSVQCENANSLIMLDNSNNISSTLNDKDIIAKSAVLIDGDSGRTLFEKNANMKMAMASTTKIMTCIVALENADTNQIVKVSKKATTMPKVKMNERVGEEYKLKDLLYAMMLESFNDVAVTVAEAVAGSVENFSDMMNKKAKEIGMNSSHFVTPNGLDATGHYSTAYDMAKLGAYAIKNKEFLEITNTPVYSFNEISSGRNIQTSNKDAFLTMDNNAIGIKTGFTSKAGYCFVGAWKKGKRTFVSCVLGSGWPPNKGFKWKDTRKLINFGKENCYYKNILTRKNLNVNIYGGNKKSIKATMKGKTDFLIKKTDKIQIKTKINYRFPIHNKEKIGDVEIWINNKKIKNNKIIAKEKVEKYDFFYCLRKIFNKFILQ